MAFVPHAAEVNSMTAATRRYDVGILKVALTKGIPASFSK